MCYEPKKRWRDQISRDLGGEGRVVIRLSEEERSGQLRASKELMRWLYAGRKACVLQAGSPREKFVWLSSNCWFTAGGEWQ